MPACLQRRASQKAAWTAGDACSISTSWVIITILFKISNHVSSCCRFVITQRVDISPADLLNGWDLAKWVKRLTANAEVETVLCPSILRHNGIWGVADEAVFFQYKKKSQKSPSLFFQGNNKTNKKIKMLYTFILNYNFCRFKFHWEKHVYSYL